MAYEHTKEAGRNRAPPSRQSEQAKDAAARQSGYLPAKVTLKGDLVSKLVAAYFAKYDRIYDPIANLAALAIKEQTQKRRAELAKLYPKKQTP